MFLPHANVQIHLFGQPVDMRKSFDGLHNLVRSQTDWLPMSGHLFCFINRSANQMKALYWDRTGYCIWAKRLEAGRFIKDWSQITTHSMDPMSFQLMLEGLEIVRKNRRYDHEIAMKKLQKNMGLV
jgi:transposase